MKRTRLELLGILGVISLLSYTAAVFFSPLAYPGYDMMSQAVSDLSADNSPSKTLWTQLSALYGVCGTVSVTAVCVFIKNRLTKAIRAGIYLFAAMEWISHIGYKMFPLTESGNAGSLQDIIHIYVVTVLVVALSIISLTVIIIGGLRERKYISLSIYAAAALAAMFIGAIGTAAAPEAVFGIFERFSVFAATGFNAVLGFYLLNGFKTREERKAERISQ